MVDYAASTNCSGSTEPRYSGIKDSLKNTYERIYKNYGKYAKGLDQNTFNTFLGRVDKELADFSGTVPRHKKEDLIAFGRFIEFDPNGRNNTQTSNKNTQNRNNNNRNHGKRH